MIQSFPKLAQRVRGWPEHRFAAACPAQMGFCTHGAHLAACMARLVTTDPSQRERVVLCVDGVTKSFSEEGCSFVVDDAVMQALGQAMPLAEILCVTLDPGHGYPAPTLLANNASSSRLEETLKAMAPHRVVACGSGSLTDVVKHAVHGLRQQGAAIDFWVLPTALTVTAFTSRFAVLGEEGHKVTRPSALPDAVLFCMPFLSGAPPVLKAAGVGDLLAGHVSYGDWYLGHRLGVSPDYLSEPAELMMPLHSYLLDQDAQGGEKDPGTHGQLVALAEVLAAAGLAMNLGGSSAPQSGGEHAISHVLDALRHLSDRPRHLHGLQVALAALATSALHDWLDEWDFVPTARLETFDASDLRDIVERLFWLAPFTGTPSEFVDSARRKDWIDERRDTLESFCHSMAHTAELKAAQWRSLKERWPAIQKEWPEIQRERRRLCASAAQMAQSMQRWGLPVCAEDMVPPSHVAEWRWALRMSVFFRPRFGVQDLVFFMGEDPVMAAAL
jgi:glycerol-1-phosphate dehydrogenase [NAD(P)+]